MKILVGYDGTPLAQRALAVAQKRAKALNAELYVVTSAGTGDIEKNKSAKLQSGLKEVQMMCKACQIDCQIEMSHHNRPVAEDLLHFATAEKVDEIVIGLSKRSQLGKLLFGSTSRQVLLEASCPVLTVK